MRREDAKIEVLFDLEKTMAGEYLKKFAYPWEVLKGLGELIVELGQSLPQEEYQRVGENIWIHKSVVIPPTVCLTGPMIVGEGSELRHCAYFRGNVLVGKNAVVGNSCEVKNSIIFDGAQTPHYNYIGDSIIGYKSHLGASSLTSNVKSDKALVKIHFEDGDVETGMKKVGAIVGDGTEVGCGSILNPGTIIGKNANIYPLSSVRGCVDANCIYKCQGEIVNKR